MYVLFFIINIASIVKFINRGLGENLISHGTKLSKYQVRTRSKKPSSLKYTSLQYLLYNKKSCYITNTNTV